MTRTTTRPIPPAWVVALDEFDTALRAGGSPATTRATRANHLRRVARSLGGDPYTLDGQVLVDWCGRQDWSIETRRGYRGTLLSFYRWATASGRAATNPADELPRVKAAIPTPRPAPEIAYREALARADERGRLILRLAAESGLRRAEVAQVHRRDLVDDLTGTSLVVHGKGGKDRVLPLSESLAAELRRYGTGRGFVFPGNDHGHLSPRWVGKVVAELLPGAYTMHTLRHRFATRAYSVDRDTFTVQELLGHASPDTTRRYVAVPRDSLRRTVNAVGVA